MQRSNPSCRACRSMRILLLALLLLLSFGRTISAALHGMFAAAHLSVTHLLIALHLLLVLHLIHRVLLIMLTSGLSHFAGVHHLGLVISAHVFPVTLMFVLHLVFVACDFSGSAITCTRASALPITFAHVVAIVIFTFPCAPTRSGSRIGAFFMLSHGPLLVRAFSTARSCALTSALV